MKQFDRGANKKEKWIPLGCGGFGCDGLAWDGFALSVGIWDLDEFADAVAKDDAAGVELKDAAGVEEADVGVKLPWAGGSGFLSGRVFLTKIWLDSVSMVISPVSRSIMRIHSFGLEFLTRPLKF